jgi:ribosomal protein S12 methylthiotransferase
MTATRPQTTVSRADGPSIAPTAALVHLGCDKNTVDGERMLGELNAGGYEIHSADRPPDDRPLDLLIVNTCAFLGAAREESVDALLEAADRKRRGEVCRVAVAGCFSKLLYEGLTEELREDIDYFIGPGDIPRTLQIVSGREEAHFRPPARSMDPGPRLLTGSASTAFVRVAEGCDKNCSFCTIPSFRGKFISRDPSLILDEVRALARMGVKEIVLVSQDTANYGLDIGLTLAALVRRIGDVAEETTERFRIRIHYLYPSQVTEDLVEAVATTASVVPYWDMPIQHTSPAVLRAMRRPPNPDSIVRVLEMIRSRFDESAIRTTVITGHPGETPAEFDRLMKFIERHEFDRLGVFPFSPEPGTPSFEMPRPRGAKKRASEVMALQAGISRRRLEARIGREYEILMDTASEGRSPFEAPDVDGVVKLEGRLGTFVRAVITGTSEHDLEGRAIMSGSRSNGSERGEPVEPWEQGGQGAVLRQAKDERLHSASDPRMPAA